MSTTSAASRNRTNGRLRVQDLIREVAQKVLLVQQMSVVAEAMSQDPPLDQDRSIKIMIR